MGKFSVLMIFEISLIRIQSLKSALDLSSEKEKDESHECLSF